MECVLTASLLCVGKYGLSQKVRAVSLWNMFVDFWFGLVLVFVYSFESCCLWHMVRGIRVRSNELHSQSMTCGSAFVIVQDVRCVG